MKNNFKKGFTVVEMLVAVTIFSLFFIAIISVFISILNVQREAFTINYITDHASYSLEYIYKQIRDAQSIEEIEENNIKIIDKKGNELNITTQDGVIKLNDILLTPKDINVELVILSNNEEDNNPHKKITILFKMDKDNHSLTVQKTISLRNPSF